MFVSVQDVNGKTVIRKRLKLGSEEDVAESYIGNFDGYAGGTFLFRRRGHPIWDASDAGGFSGCRAGTG